RSTFYVLGAIGLIWAVAWFLMFKDNPENHKRITPEEKTYILASRQEKKANSGKGKPPLKSLIRSKNMWLAMGQYFCSNFTNFFALTWLFPHIKNEYGLDAVEAGIYTSVPLIFGAFGNWSSGALVDKIYRNGNWRRSRTLPAIIGFSLAAVGLIGSIYMDTPVGAIVFLSLAIFGADMTLAPSWSFCVDIGKEFSGTVSGTMNMAGNLGSFVTALIFPYLAAWWGSSTLFFVVGAVLNLIAILFWINMNPQQQLIKI
ncbi:MAG: MFS transporter, partial [Bacteroidota bacterium]